MRRSRYGWAILAAFALVAYPACSRDAGGDTGVPTTETPRSLQVPVTLPTGVSGTHLRADAVTRGGPVWSTLAQVPLSTPTLALPATLPASVGILDPDVATVLCAGADTTPTPSRQPGLWLELRELWLVEGETLVALRSASRADLSLDVPSGFEVGDVVRHWVYVDRSLTLVGVCSYPFGVIRSVDLDLAAGWNALATRVDAAVGGVPTALTTSTASDHDLPWHAAERVLAGVDALWAPPSATHGPRGSWWGVNQSKLVRSGDDLWLSVVDNAAAVPVARVVQRVADAWHEVGAWPSESPAQLVLMGGEPWALVHEVDASATSDTLGSVVMYDRDGGPLPHPTPSDRVNVRYGATVTSDGDLLLAWGNLVSLPDLGAQREDLWFQTLDAASGSWSGFSTTDLGISFRYPYVAQDEVRLVAAIAENTFVGSGQENLYHRLLLVQASSDGAFAFERVVVDVPAEFSDLPSPLPNRLVEVSDVTIDTDGDAHVLLKVFAGTTSTSPPSLHHRVAPAAVAASEERPPDPPLPPAPAWSDWTALDTLSCSWARFVALPGRAEPAVACARHGHLGITTLDGSRSVALRVPPGVHGPYLYVAEGRSGSSTAEAWIDLFLVAGSASAYPNGPALVLSVDRATVAALLE